MVFRDLFNACIKLQKNTTFTNVSEDQRNDFIRDILETAGYQIKDQTRQGKSASGKASGEIDILNRSVITKTRGAHRNRFPEAPLVFLFILSAELYRCHLIRLFEQAVKMLHVLISHTRCNRLHRLI